MLVVVALVVALVAIDAIAKLDKARPPKRSDSSEKVIVDLTRRQ